MRINGMKLLDTMFAVTDFFAGGSKRRHEILAEAQQSCGCVCDCILNCRCPCDCDCNTCLCSCGCPCDCDCNCECNDFEVKGLWGDPSYDSDHHQQYGGLFDQNSDALADTSYQNVGNDLSGNQGVSDHNDIDSDEEIALSQNLWAPEDLALTPGG